METFAFIKIANLPAYEKALIKNSTISEVITKLGITLGAAIKLDIVPNNTINISKEWNRKKSSSMETIYEIEPDSQPRSVFAVYQLSAPVITSNSTYSIRTQCKEIIRHVAYKKTLSKKTGIGLTCTTFVFYACIEQDENDHNKKWLPKQFLITEPHVEPDSLQCDLISWRCLHAASIRARHKTAYIKLSHTTAAHINNYMAPSITQAYHSSYYHSYHHDNIYTQAYLNSPKNILCYQCRHQWSSRQLKDMIDCSIKVPKSSSSLDKRIKALETTHHTCGLWQLYFPPQSQTIDINNNGHQNQRRQTNKSLVLLPCITKVALLSLLLFFIANAVHQ